MDRCAPEPDGGNGLDRSRSSSVVFRECHVKLLSSFIHDESGATAIEYALIAALIAIVIVTAATSVGSKLSSTFTAVAGSF